MSKYIILYFTIMLLNHNLFGQKEAKTAVEGINYTIEKLEKDSTNKTGPAGIRVSIPHNQFNNPEHVVLALNKQNGETVFSFVAHTDLLSGALMDSLNIFSVDGENFIFNVRGVPPRNYEVVLQVLLADGNAYFIKTEEDWWKKKGGNRP